MTIESIHCDILIVGAGPAGLAAAIRLKQLKPSAHICILEKGAEVGSHIISGAVFESDVLRELLPDFKIQGTAVKKDYFYYLTQHNYWRLPALGYLNNSHSKHNIIISLSNLCRDLAKEAEKWGIEIYPGFAARDMIIENNVLMGIKTGEVDMYADITLLAEGCRGSLSQKIIEYFKLDKHSDPQTYGLGVKELWEIDPSRSKAGHVMHTVGWPLDNAVYGGSFLYYLDNNLVSVGIVTGLDYKNLSLDPFKELQRFKRHPLVRDIFTGAKQIGYGAKSLVEGGFQSLPQLDFPGGFLIGDSAGFLNVPKIKGIHTAMKSGILVAEYINNNKKNRKLNLNYTAYFKQSDLYHELYLARNIRLGFKYGGLILGLVLAFIDMYIFRGRAPWTLHHKKPDYKNYDKNISDINYSDKNKNQKSNALYLATIHHDDRQPIHLKVKNTEPDKITRYDYCPAGVYEVFDKKLLIHAQNCLHCKACDIKDPYQNIEWTPPDGGSGPNYSGL